ncbi:MULTISPECIES: tyrosine-type recombinase/integrase [Arenibacter]|uniref:tyrosine-type recombinase/integrase n=1 Tax=Arenibacter TaxID=178469 RepID=UPI0004DFC761|nr:MULTISPECIES: site-specific integrase [Arenibacter]GBF22378.1 site-specific tyrosine recombinase XerC [Arenibacter sp. NBRC 103722]
MAIVERSKGRIRFAFKDALKELVKNPKKESLLMLHFSYGKLRFKYSTGYSSCYNDWDYQKQRVRNKAHLINSGYVNDLLNTLETELYKTVSAIESRQGIINKEVLRRKLDEITNKTQEEEIRELSFYEYIDKFLDRKEGKIAKVTLRSYKQTNRLLKEYNNALRFEDIDIDFYYGFLEFLENDDKSLNTIGKHIKNLKSFLNSATQDGLNKNLFYTNSAFKAPKEQTTAIYLDELELKKMADYDFSGYRNWGHARDIFLIGCYTGQRVSDYNGLTKANYLIKDGVRFFKIKQKKTGREVFCPITHETQAILSKYDNNPPPKMNEQDINEFIKEVGRKVGLNDMVSNSYTKGGVEHVDEVMKYKLIGTHTARRSFCTNMYKKGMSIYDIMHFSGHSTEREFYKYIRIEKEQRAIKIAQSGYFNLA